jgi:hypothetical protein
MYPLTDIELLRHIEEALEKILRIQMAKPFNKFTTMKIFTMPSSEDLR